MRKNKYAWAYLPIFLSLLIIYIFFSIKNQGLFYQIFNSDLSDMTNYIASYGKLAPLMLLILIIIEVVAAPIPGMILYVAAGTILGSFYGGLVSFIGNIIGSMICFYLAWKGRTFFFKRTKSDMLETFDHYSLRFGGLAIFFLRLNPFTSSDIVSYLAGFSKMRFRQFIIGTSLGLLPITFISSYLGGEIITSHPILYKIFVFVSILYFAGAIYLLYLTKTFEKIKMIRTKIKEKAKDRKNRKILAKKY